MSGSGYRLEDEPSPTALERVVVAPMWPLLGSMLGMTLLGWVWFLVNGHGMGSPTRRAEALWVAAGVGGGYVLLFGITTIIERFVPAAEHPSILPYALLGLVVWKLFVTYELHVLQSRVYEIYLYYQGTPRSGLLAVAALALLSGLHLKLFPPGILVWLLPLL